MLHRLLFFLTDYGDSAVTGTFTVVIAVFLLIYRERRAAAAMVLAFLTSSALITFGKIVLYSRGFKLPFRYIDLWSPSGHTAISVAVYVTFAAILASTLSGRRRILPYIVVAPFAIGIPVSRVLLDMHSKSDVLFGFGFGLLAFILVWIFFLRNLRARTPWYLLTIVALAVLALTHGLRFPAEDIVDKISEVVAKMHPRKWLAH